MAVIPIERGRKAPVHTGAMSCLDLFLAVWARQECNLEDLGREFFLPEPAWLVRPLEEALALGLVVMQEGRVGRSANPRAEALYRSLNFALAYGIDYNVYLDPAVQTFLKGTYGKSSFKERDLPRQGWTVDLLRRLVGHGVLLLYGYEPLIGRWVNNPFLDDFCAFLNMRQPKPSVEAPSALARARDQRLSACETPTAASSALGEGSEAEDVPSLDQRLVRHDLMRMPGGLLDAAGRRRQEEALVAMRGRVRDGRPLSRELVVHYHLVLMGDSAGAGRLRRGRLEVPGNPRFKVASPEEVERQLTRLLQKVPTLSGRGVGPILQEAAWLCNEFLSIQPFEEGNEMLARVLTAHFLRERRAPLEEIPPVFDLWFLLATTAASKRSDGVLAGLLGDVLLQALNRRDLSASRARRS